MNRKTKLTVIISGVILVTVLIILLFSGFGDTKNLIENPNVPNKKYWSRVITVEDAGGGFKIAINAVDGYRITVPTAWGVGDEASYVEGLDIYSAPDSLGIESFGGVLLNINTFENLDDIKKFVPEDIEFREVIVGGEIIYKTSYKQFEFNLDENYNSVYTPIENSGTIAYIIRGDRKYYLASCTVIGEENYIELLSQCERQIRTFEIIK